MHSSLKIPVCDYDFPRSGRTGYIYLITNLINGKQYVGQTRLTIPRRWTAHRQNALKPTTAITYAIRKYGAENFQVTYLGRVESTDVVAVLDALEKYHIQQLGTMWPNGYNIHAGGRNPPLSDATKEKIRQAHLGRKASPETRAKMSALRKGRKLSPQHADAVRRADRSHVIPRRGFTISDKQKAQISVVHKGKVLSPETKAKLRAANLGKKASIETINKMRIAQLARHRRIVIE